MVTIIKQKGEGLVCIRTEIEKPVKILPTKDGVGIYNQYYDSQLKEWLESFEKYPVKSKTEFIFYFRHYHPKYKDCALLEFEWDLKEGIEIDSKLVDVKCEHHSYCSLNRIDCKQYAILVSPEEESNEDVEAVLDNLLIKRGEHPERVRNPLYGEERQLAKDLLSHFLSRKNK